MLSLSLIAFASLAAFLAGFIDAIAGGGGLITLPALLLTGIPPHHVLAVNKVSSSLGTASALSSFALRGLVRFDIALRGIAFSLLGAFLGSIIALHVDNELLGKILAAMLPLAFVLTLLPGADRGGKKERPLSFLRIALLTFSIGLYDGFFGPGTGTILILIFHWLIGLDLLHASATAKVFNLASNCASAVTFIVEGAVLWSVALPMALASISGNILGSRFAIIRGNVWIRHVLSFSLFLLTLSLLFKYFF
ncbi:MAG: TSUP family transporter [Desulfovibrio sp.]|nr:TSUP family transporter [Desulfovibrio sp.]